MWQKQDTRWAQRRENISSVVGKDPAQSGVFDGSDDYDNDGSFDWIDELDESRLDWLFI